MNFFMDNQNYIHSITSQGYSEWGLKYVNLKLCLFREPGDDFSVIQQEILMMKDCRKSVLTFYLT